MTFADMITDLWAHKHANDPKLREQEVDDDFDATLRELNLDEESLRDAGPGEVIAEANYEAVVP